MRNLTHEILLRPGVSLKDKLSYIKRPRIYVPNDVLDFQQNMEFLHPALIHHMINRASRYEATIYIENVSINILKDGQKIKAVKDQNEELAAICEMYDDTASQRIYWPFQNAIIGFEKALKDNIEIDNEVLLLHLAYDMKRKNTFVVEYLRRPLYSDKGRRATIEELLGLFHKPLPQRA